MPRKVILIILAAIATLGCLESTVATQVVIPTSTLQETPVVVSTVLIQPTSTLTVGQKKTVAEIKNLENQNTWFWIGNIISFFSFIVIPLSTIIGLYRWYKDQKLDREKRAEDQQFEREKRAEDYKIEQAKLDEERFQAVVGGLGSERVEARVGSAIMLLTFLNKGYEKFYSQAFLLAVAHLRLRKAEPNTPEPLDALSQALIIVLKESFSKARDNMPVFTPESLDATGVHLDNAYLSKTDLKKIRMRDASLRGAYFWMAELQDAYFKHSNMESAIFGNAHLEEADLGKTILKHANLTEAHLRGADLYGANLDFADFTNADLTDTNPEQAKSLIGTILRDVKGLSETQLAECASKGAIIDNLDSP